LLRRYFVEENPPIRNWKRETPISFAGGLD
jgi:hypothetical protein